MKQSEEVLPTCVLLIFFIVAYRLKKHVSFRPSLDFSFDHCFVCFWLVSSFVVGHVASPVVSSVISSAASALFFFAPKAADGAAGSMNDSLMYVKNIAEANSM
jgi:hypothetical protein